MTSDPRFDHIPDSNLRECLINAEDECDSLRRILAWCGPRLSPTDRATVAQMVRDKITKDGREEDREEMFEAQRLCLKFASLVDEACNAPGNPPQYWYTRAVDLSSKAREFEPRSREATLAELRSFKEI